MKNISEFNPQKGYREFYSMRELVSTLSRLTIVWSWGAHNWTQMSKYLLRFKVQAYRHKGYIFIAVNGSDLFDVWLTDLKGNIKHTFTDIFIEDLVEVIDEKIEKQSNYEF